MRRRKKAKTGKKLSKNSTLTALSQKQLTRQKTKSKAKPLTAKAQLSLITLLEDLLKNGFTLQESLRFMQTLLPEQKQMIEKITKELARGQPLYQTFSVIGFNQQHVAQLSLAEVHGDLGGTLARIANQLQERANYRQQLIKLLSYPVILLVFLSGLIASMKWFLLPRLTLGEEQGSFNLGLWLVERGPALLLVFLLLSLAGALLLRHYLKQQSAIKQARVLVRLPWLKKLLPSYYTAFFAFEWGKLLQQGLELKLVIQLIRREGSTPLMQEIGQELDHHLRLGQPLASQMTRWNFFEPGLYLIIQQGEAKSKLGEELMIYSRRLQAELFKTLNRWLLWLQPLVFLLISFLIISLYAALLLPIYQGMEDLL